MQEEGSGPVQARLALEAENLAAEVAASSHQPMQLRLDIARLEASEHLPCSREHSQMSPDQVRQLHPPPLGMLFSGVLPSRSPELPDVCPNQACWSFFFLALGSVFCGWFPATASGSVSKPPDAQQQLSDA